MWRVLCSCGRTCLRCLYTAVSLSVKREGYLHQVRVLNASCHLYATHVLWFTVSPFSCTLPVDSRFCCDGPPSLFVTGARFFW